MKAFFEKVIPENDTSWGLLIRNLENIPFEWHFHPEFELTLTLNSSGERYVGDTITTYSDNDLTLLGPNIPHSWSSQKTINPEEQQKVFVLWFTQEWINNLIKNFPEFKEVEKLTERANQGLIFSDDIAQKIKSLSFQLEKATPSERTILLLQILNMLCEKETYQPILSQSSATFAKIDTYQQSRLARILDYVHQHYHTKLTLENISKNTGMSTSTLNRLFQQHIGQSIGNYLIQVRIAKACSLMIGTDKPVSMIAEISGFNNQTNFNRHFIQYKGMTPREFRQKYKTQH